MDVVVIAFDGDIGEFPALIQTLDGLVADGARRVVVDLGSLPFINSAALGYLVGKQQELERRGGELALCRLQPALVRILDMTELDAVLPAFQTEAEAVAYLGGDASRPPEEDATGGGVRRIDCG